MTVATTSYSQTAGDKSPDCQEYSATQLCSSIRDQAESTTIEQCCDTPHRAGTNWSGLWTTRGTFLLHYNLAAGRNKDMRPSSALATFRWHHLHYDLSKNSAGNTFRTSLLCMLKTEIYLLAVQVWQDSLTENALTKQRSRFLIKINIIHIYNKNNDIM